MRRRWKRDRPITPKGDRRQSAGIGCRLPTPELAFVGPRAQLLTNHNVEALGTRQAEGDIAALSALITQHEAGLLAAWVRNQLEAGSLRSGQIKEDELKDQSTRFLRDFTIALKSGEVDDITGQAWNECGIYSTRSHARVPCRGSLLRRPRPSFSR